MLIRTTTTLALAALLPLCAFADEGKLSIADAQAQQDTLIVVRDAETGKLRAATADERANLQSLRAVRELSSQRSSASPVTPRLTKLANGATGVRLTDEMMGFSVMVRRADGKLEEVCFPTKEEANAFVAKGPAAAALAQSELPTK